MVFSATLNNISAISWSVFLVKETGVPGENHRPAASRCQTGSHNDIQCNLSNPTHQGTREMCRIGQDVKKLRF